MPLCRDTAMKFLFFSVKMCGRGGWCDMQLCTILVFPMKMKESRPLSEIPQCPHLVLTATLASSFDLENCSVKQFHAFGRFLIKRSNISDQLSLQLLALPLAFQVCRPVRKDISFSTKLKQSLLFCRCLHVFVEVQKLVMNISA